MYGSLWHNDGVTVRKRFTFWIDAHHDAALKMIKQRDGVPATEQLRRALDRWIEEKGVTGKKAARTRTTRKRS
jgi:hypothetical protein